MKHLDTITQIFNMDKCELEQLATFMGHTEKTHSEFYRLPNDVFQTGKISKLLLLSQTDDFEKHKGKSLKEIDLGEDLLEETDKEDEINDDGINDYDEDGLQDNEKILNFDSKNGKKRILVPWTSAQKSTAKIFFKKNILEKIPPKKKEIEELKKKYPGLYNNKTWLQIKVFVCNIYNKKYK